MDNPDQADYLVEQMLIAVAGLALMLWATRDINRRADQTIDSLGR
jgi:hypothetical protein